MGDAECNHIWVSNSGQGGEPDYRKNRMMWSGERMHVKCSECNTRTWMTKEQWEALIAHKGDSDG